jgi:hypothetical protein
MMVANGTMTYRGQSWKLITSWDAVDIDIHTSLLSLDVVMFAHPSFLLGLLAHVLRQYRRQRKWVLRSRVSAHRSKGPASACNLTVICSVQPSQSMANCCYTCWQSAATRADKCAAACAAACAAKCATTCPVVPGNVLHRAIPAASNVHHHLASAADSGAVSEDQVESASQLPPIGSLSISKRGQQPPQPPPMQQNSGHITARKQHLPANFQAHQAAAQPATYAANPLAPMGGHAQAQHAGQRQQPRTGGQRPSYSSLGITGGNKLAPMKGAQQQAPGAASMTGVTGINKYKNAAAAGKNKGSYVSPYAQRALPPQ